METSAMMPRPGLATTVILLAVPLVAPTAVGQSPVDDLGPGDEKWCVGPREVAIDVPVVRVETPPQTTPEIGISVPEMTVGVPEIASPQLFLDMGPPVDPQTLGPLGDAADDIWPSQGVETGILLVEKIEGIGLTTPEQTVELGAQEIPSQEIDEGGYTLTFESRVCIEDW